jgi:hypothetical protein
LLLLAIVLACPVISIQLFDWTTVQEAPKIPEVSEGHRLKLRTNPFVDVFNVRELIHAYVLFDVEWHPKDSVMEEVVKKANAQIKKDNFTMRSIDNWFPATRIIDPEDADVCLFAGRACAYTFELQPKKGIPWIRLDEMRVVVHNYELLPRITKDVHPSPTESYHTYYVEIDNPEKAGKKEFIASYYYQSGEEVEGKLRREKPKRDPFVFVRLIEGKPEAFYLRINAKTAGIYTFSCVLTLSHKDSFIEECIVNSAVAFRW